YERALDGVDDAHQWRAARLDIDFDAIVPRETRQRWRALPGAADVRGRTIPIEYDVETNDAGESIGVARLRIPEKLARLVTPDDLPELDRPLRFAVHRGARG